MMFFIALGLFFFFWKRGWFNNLSDPQDQDKIT
jgi:magnesium transporter